MLHNRGKNKPEIFQSCLLIESSPTHDLNPELPDIPIIITLEKVRRSTGSREKIQRSGDREVGVLIRDFIVAGSRTPDQVVLIFKREQLLKHGIDSVTMQDTGYRTPDQVVLIFKREQLLKHGIDSAEQ